MAWNVVGLENWEKIGPNTVDRSTMYKAARDSLSLERRAILDRIEQQLFSRSANGTGTEVCTKLMFDRHTFRCAEGEVTHYYSLQRMKHILLNFSLYGGGGGGGMPRPANDTPKNGKWIGARAFEWCDKIAARVGAAAWPVTAAGVKQKFGLLTAGLQECRHAIVLKIPMIYWSSRSDLNSIDEAGALLRTYAVLFSDRSQQLLPEWSILSGKVEAREQLENSFARKILAGEFVCRFSRSLSDIKPRRRSRFLDSHSHNGDTSRDMRSLFEESTRILHTIHAPQQISPPAYARHYCTIPKVNHDWLGDDAALQLIRSEMTLNLASSLMEKRIRNLGPHSDAMADEETPSTSDLINRFALLCRFVVLSEHFFGVKNAGLDMIDLKPQSSVRAPARYVMGLNHFGLSCTLLVEQMTDRTEVESAAGRDSSDVLDELIKLTAGVLDIRDDCDRDVAGN